MGVKWPASRPGRALAPAEGPPVPNVQEAAWAPEPVRLGLLDIHLLRLRQAMSKIESVHLHIAMT
jgi:hypothetical protein